MTMTSAIDTFATGYLPVTDNQTIYWEASGNPAGKPALYLHGGPGAGIKTGYRRMFDPERHLIVSFEQRGCGRSLPTVSDADLSKNTTQALISDIEALRLHFKVEAWLVCGVSWGTALALAYAQAHPDRVSALALGAVSTLSRDEVEWITEQMHRLFPREWDQFAAAVRPRPGQRLIDRYYECILNPDPEVREATVRAWCAWEDVHVSLDPKYQPNPSFQDPNFRLVFATLVIHYWKHSGFFEGKGLLGNMARIAHIPGALVHGRWDVSSPLETAWELHKAWPRSTFVVIDDEGHGGEKMVAELTAAIARLT